MNDTHEYVAKTLRATGILVVMMVAVLVNFGLPWAIVPALAGLALAVVLLLGWWAFIRSQVATYRPEAKKSAVKARQRRRFLLLAMVKYPLVGILICWLTRVWSANELAAFVAGFSFLTLVIASRAVGKLLTERDEVKTK